MTDEAKLAEIRAALEPFAASAQYYSDVGDNTPVCYRRTTASRLSVGDLRRAAKALAVLDHIAALSADWPWRPISEAPTAMPTCPGAQAMSELAKLLPCPFCGGAPKHETVNGPLVSDGDVGGEYIACETCGVSTMLVFPLKEDALPKLMEMWNRRSPSPPRDAVVEALRTIRDYTLAEHDVGFGTAFMDVQRIAEDALAALEQEPPHG